MKGERRGEEGRRKKGGRGQKGGNEAGRMKMEEVRRKKK
jgi:hypothetical protein